MGIRNYPELRNANSLALLSFPRKRESRNSAKIQPGSPPEFTPHLMRGGDDKINMEKKEIKIIGAGLSGLTAGINLAKAGYKVKIFEKNDTVGKRFHGDYQGIENWVYNQDALECIQQLNIEISFPYYSVRQVKIIGPQGKIYSIQFQKNVFYLVRRGIAQDTLDHNLYEQAKLSGVEVIFNAPQDYRQFGDIIAQGFIPDRVTDALVPGYTFKTKSPDQYWVIVDDAIAPDGYGYCFIVNGLATLAICIYSDFSKSKENLERAYDVFQKNIHFEANDKIFFCGTSNGFLMKNAVFDNRLYVGEAAGFIDCLWGFGMKYAMISGYLAAQSIIKNQNYNYLWKKEIGSQFKASFVNHWYYKMLGKRSYQWILDKMRKSADPAVSLNKMCNYSIVQKLGFPLAFCFLRKKAKDRRKL